MQNFLQIWKQDPLAQQTLCIAPDNIFICDAQNSNQITDITTELEEHNQTYTIEPEENFFEEFIHQEINEDNRTLTEEMIALEEPRASPIRNELIPEEPRLKNIQEIIDDVTRPLKPTGSHPNPFLASTWQIQLEKIIKRLQEARKMKKGRIGLLEAHYYLGKILKENTNYKDQIQDQLEQKFGERRTRDLWISAHRLREIFSICDKSCIYQNEVLTVTKITKLKELEFSTLIGFLIYRNL